MNPIALLKRASLKNILKIIFIGLKRPLFVTPTIEATRQCIKIATKNYGKLHHKNGRANAFRHAFWNYLIAKRCLKWANNYETVLSWAKRITDWHENAFPNNQLAKKMDFHNNAVGRMVFEQNLTTSEDEVLKLLKEMTKDSIKIDENSDLSMYKDQLVHIIDR
ncbi:DUF6973 domain-containing protein [Flagellimonas ochracea]|nr:hypothetical protein [Allomuricauda ochracea]